MKKILVCGLLVALMNTVRGMDATKVRAKRRIGSDFMHAVLKPDNEKVKQILRPVDVNQKDGIGWAAIHYAARDLNVELVKILLEQPGIDIDATNGNGHTALQIIERKTPNTEQAEQCKKLKELFETFRTFKKSTNE